MTQIRSADGSAGLAKLPPSFQQGCPFGPSSEYAELRAHTPLSKVECPTGITAWLVTRYADVRAVLGNPRTFSARPGAAAHILAHMRPDLPVGEGDFGRLDGPAHLRFRRHMAPEVSSRQRMEQLSPLVRGIVADRLDRLAAMTPPVDLHTAFSQPVTASVIAELLGVPPEEQPTFRRAADTLFDAMVTPDRLEEAFAPLLGYLHELVGKRRTEPGGDALSSLVTRAEAADARFSERELVVMASALLTAGYDSTASLLTHGILLLLRHPDELSRLRADPGLAVNAADELVRHLGAGTGVLREVVEDTEIGGQPVSAGEFLVLAVQSANRDTELAADPDRLDVGRRPLLHMGFGHGPHQCVGRQLARLQIATVLDMLPRRIPTLGLAVPFEQVEFKTESMVLGPAALPVTWETVRPDSTPPGPR